MIERRQPGPEERGADAFVERLQGAERRGFDVAGIAAVVVAVLREPLTRFLLLGALLFGLNAIAKSTDDPAIAVPPNAPDSWLDEELLFREARALGLDRADPIVRRRLVQKLEMLIELPADSETPSEAQLRALLEAHPQRYGRPARYSVEQLAFLRGQRGERLHIDAEAALQQLRAGTEVQGDTFFAGRHLDDLDAEALRGVFGRSFAASIESLQPGAWHGPIASGYGLHLVRLHERKPFEPASLEAARRRLLIDWSVARKQALLRERLTELRRQYRIER